jgi:hypothetical protein
VLVFASLYSEFIADAGAAAASMAVGGFIGQALPALKGAPDETLRRYTAFGGVAGLCIAAVVIVLSSSQE